MTGKPPLYARVLRLRHVHPGGLLCFLFFEGAVALGILLALADFAPWWSALVLPVAVAAMVKINDFVAGWNARARLVPAHARAGNGWRPMSTGRVAVPRARPAQTPPPASRLPGGRSVEGELQGSRVPLDKARVSGRVSAPGALGPAELPGFGSGAGSLGVRPSSTGAVYRHASGSSGGSHHDTGGDASGEHRRGPNQGRFGQSG